MIFTWFEGKASKEFGCELAHLVIGRLRLEAPIAKGRLAEKKHDAMLHQLMQHVQKFKKQHKLNIYKKAKVGSGFKLTLKDKGYDKDYVDQLTHWLMLNL